MYEQLLDLNYLLNAFNLCKKNVSWKASTQRYELQLFHNLNELKNQLENHTYKQKPFSEFTICERGKTRNIKALHISDRVLQRALCELIYSSIKKYLIYDNGASQKRKGIEFSRRRLKTHLEKYYKKYGNNGYILKIVFSKYFDNIDHKELLRLFEKYIDDKEVINLIVYLVSTFGEKGCGIGSQLSQIAGIIYPLEIDNFCKIKKQCKFYGRYMDDIYIIHSDKEFLKQLLKEIEVIAEKLKIKINKKKTQIIKLKNGFTFLQMRYLFNDNGKIVVIPNKKTMTREKRKLKKLVYILNKDDFTFQYKTWKGSLKKFDCYKSVHNVDLLYKNLLEDIK